MAVHVSEVGLQAADDALVASAERAEGRVVVTENVADYAAERDLVLVFVPKKNLPQETGKPPRSPRRSTGGHTTSPTPISARTGHRY
ncbi:MAG TPA: hypothetical protein VF834_24390 [Streptosporangiaceae bacterium]